MLKSKSISAGVILVALTFLVACQEEPMPGEVSLSVNTAAMYDELHISHDVAVRIAGKDYVLVDSLLVYDEQDRLVSRLGAESKTLGTLSIDIPDLEDGTYYVVLFQTCHQTDGKSRWQVFNAYQLSSLLIKQTDTWMDCISALGIKCERVTIKNGNAQADLTPEAAGCILEGRLDGFAEASFPIIGIPPVKMCGVNTITGIYPGRQDDTRWVFSSFSREEIGSLDEDTPSRKFFTLCNGNKVTLSLGSDYYTYCENEANLLPGNNYVFYHKIASESFYDSFFGTPEDLEAFILEQAGNPCTFAPYLQWGASKEEIDQYVRSRSIFPCEKSSTGILMTGINMGIPFVEYDIAPGLSEYYFFDSLARDHMVAVEYQYEGTVSREQAETGLKQQGYKYMGRWYNMNFIGHYYLSDDGQIECLAIHTTEIIIARGYEAWKLDFQPFNPQNLAHLE